jgi:hypothetical protein
MIATLAMNSCLVLIFLNNFGRAYPVRAGGLYCHFELNIPALPSHILVIDQAQLSGAVVAIGNICPLVEKQRHIFRNLGRIRVGF